METIDNEQKDQKSKTDSSTIFTATKFIINTLLWIFSDTKKLSAKENKKNFKNFTIIIVALGFLITTFLLIFWDQQFSILGRPPGKISWVIFGIWLLYLLSGFKKVNINEMGAIFCYGKGICDLDPGTGLIFILKGIFKLDKETNLIIAEYCPAEPEKIFKEDDKELLPIGMVRPMRIPTATLDTAIFENDEEKKKYEKDKLSVRLVIDIICIVYIQIDSLILLRRNIGKIEKASEYTKKASENSLVKIFGDKIPPQIIHEVRSIDVDLKKELEGTLKNWGVGVRGFLLMTPDLTHPLSSALRNVALEGVRKDELIIKTTADSEALKIRAYAEKANLMLIGEGKAWAERVLLEAKTIGYDKMAKKIGVPFAELQTKLEIVEKAFVNANYSMITGGNGLNELLGFIPMMKNAMENMASPSK